MLEQPEAWARNRIALERHGPFRLALASAQSPLDFSWEASRGNGELVAVLKEAHRENWLASRYDPTQEAQKLAQSLPVCDLLVLASCASVHLLKAIHRRMREEALCERLLVLEFCPAILHGALLRIPMEELLEDPMVHWSAATDEAAVMQAITQHYLPHFFPRLRLCQPTAFNQAGNALGFAGMAWLGSAIQSMQGDFVTQSRLGKRWFYNIACNLAAAGKSTSLRVEAGRDWLVIGAGPSLEDQASRILERQASGAIVCASDAALAFCRDQGIQPDYLMSIDGQSVSYLHLLSAASSDARPLPTTLLDLCAHPLYARKAEKPVFLGSAHPLVEWFRAQGAGPAYLDCASGNVGGSMVAFAASCGARSIEVFGLDFAYLGGKPYVRPAFLYDDFGPRSRRMRPLEQQLASLYLGEQHERLAGGTRVCTARLNAYRERLCSQLAAIPAKIINHAAWQLPQSAGKAASPSPAPGHRDLPGLDSARLAAAVERYRLALQSLSGLDPLDLWEAGELEQRRVLATLLPLMAWETANLLKDGAENTDIRRRAFQRALAHAEHHFAHAFA